MPNPFYVPRMSRRVICHGEYHALDTLFSFPRRWMPGKGQVPLLTSMGLIGVKVAGPGTAESGLGKERSGNFLSKKENPYQERLEKLEAPLRMTMQSKPRPKILQTVFKEGDTKTAGPEL